MLETLYQVERHLESLLESPLHTMYIDYHKPYVSRVWFQMGEYRVYLHKIEPVEVATETLYHPHPWASAIRILKGKYEMGVGYSETNEVPKTACKLILNAGAAYEMTEENAWHYVQPLGEPSFSLMVTGELNKREMPVTATKEFRELSYFEAGEIISVVKDFYKID